MCRRERAQACKRLGKDVVIILQFTGVKWNPVNKMLSADTFCTV